MNVKIVKEYIMTSLKITIVFLLFALYACGQKTTTYKPVPAAIQLNDQAMALVPYVENPDSSRKALYLLNKATAIDSNFFIGHSNKLMFYVRLEQFDSAILTNNKLIQLRPNAIDLYLTGGMFYEQIGDTVASKTYFDKSLKICNAAIDKMDSEYKDFVTVSINQAISLIMLNDSVKANEILKELYGSLPDKPEFGNAEKEYIQSLMNKNKQDLIDYMDDID